MGTPVWYLIALLLISVKGEIYDDISQSFYEKPESSSPSPQPSPTPGLQLVGMKELVLYLTPDQAKVLEDAGAIVKPFPEFEREFIQKHQQSVEEHNDYQPTTPKEGPKQDPELEEFYKVLNVQQINEDLAIQHQAASQTTDKPHPRYKLNPKLLQQDYAASYVPKKANRAKSQSAEYVRYLPNYEFEDLKMEPYRAQPLPGYRFEDSEANLAYQRYLQGKEPTIQEPLQIKRPEEIEHYSGVSKGQFSVEEATQSQKTFESSEPNEDNIQDKGPVTFKDKSQQSLEPSNPALVQEPSKDWAPIKNHNAEEIQSPVEIKAPSELQIPVNLDTALLSQRQKEAPNYSIPEPTAAVFERQYSSLLAPLLQHEKITESIEQQKEELVNSELAIQTKLKQIKESGDHDEDKYAIELDNLNKNLGKQNALAQKLALETISKKPQTVVKEQGAFKRPSSIEFLKNIKVHTPVNVRIPKPLAFKVPKRYPDIVRPIPVPVLQSENIEVASPVPVDIEKRIPIPGNIRNVFPFLVNKAIPEVKHEFPFNYAYQPEKLTIQRHIWEH